MIILSPSILAGDFAYLADELKAVEAAGAEWIHIDVMDGVFVPNMSMGPVIVQCMRPHSKMVFDTHLMIVQPERYIEPFIKAGSDYVTIHVEATDKVSETLSRIRALGAKCGLSIKPATPVADIERYLPELDLVLIMSVEPGFGGQSYIQGSELKAEQLRALREKLGLKFLIEIDGGITTDNVGMVHKAGVDVVVAGSAMFKFDDYAEGARIFRENAVK